MTKKKFLEFGERWHYIGLVRDGDIILKHGEAAWQQADFKQRAQVIARLRENRLLPELFIEKATRSDVKSGESLDYFRQHQARKVRETRRRKASGIA